MEYMRLHSPEQFQNWLSSLNPKMKRAKHRRKFLEIFNSADAKTASALLPILAGFDPEHTMDILQKSDAEFDEASRAHVQTSDKGNLRMAGMIAARRLAAAKK